MREYRYLGTFLCCKLSGASHLAKAGGRAAYISRRLWICRSELDLRFSTNLFQMLVIPAIRMVATVYQQLPEEQNKIEVEVRRQFRSFCLLPWTCPNELVAMLMGDAGQLLRGVARSADHKSICRRNGIPLDKVLLKSARSYPLMHCIPKKLIILIKVMWGSQC